MSLVAPTLRVNVCSTSYRMSQPAGRAAALVTTAWRQAAARRVGVARRPLQHRRRRSAVAVQAVLDVSDSTFEKEVLKVNGVRIKQRRSAACHPPQAWQPTACLHLAAT